MQMSQIWLTLRRQRTPPPCRRAGDTAARVFVGRNRLEEPPRAAVALMGDVPMLGAEACSGRVYRDLLCRKGVGLATDADSAVIFTTES